MRSVLALTALALTCACAPLTAERPLFGPSDQIGPAPLTEGRWVQSGEGCVPADAESFGEDCAIVDVAREADGAWRYTMRSTAPDETTPTTWRFIIIPAVESARGEEYAPLYVAEYVSLDEDTPPFYAIVAPVGAMPAREVRMVAMIDCDDALREGPIPGVEERVGEAAFDRVCVASDTGAVRAAARRALIEKLPVLLGEPRARFVWTGPSEAAPRERLVAAR